MRECCHRKESQEEQSLKNNLCLPFFFKVTDTISLACLPSPDLGMIARWSIGIRHSLPSLVVKPMHQLLELRSAYFSLSLASNVYHTQRQLCCFFRRKKKILKTDLFFFLSHLSGCSKMCSHHLSVTGLLNVCPVRCSLFREEHFNRVT